MKKYWGDDQIYQPMIFSFSSTLKKKQVFSEINLFVKFSEKPLKKLWAMPIPFSDLQLTSNKNIVINLSPIYSVFWARKPIVNHLIAINY